MSEIHIQRFEHRARIRGEGAPVVRARIQRAMAEMIDTGFESALLHAGVDTDEQICIRRFVTRAHLDPARSDTQWAADWSTAWIDALRAVLQSGGDNVIRYRSRTHVFIEMAVRILRGDDSRAWAWRQLGVWSATPPDSPQGRIELAQVLARHPTAVLPVCHVLANEHVLGAWIAKLPEEALTALSKAALRAADADDAMFDRRGVGEAAANADAAPLDRVSRILSASPLLASLLPVANADNAAELATLMLLSAEPAALRSSGAGRLLDGVARKLLDMNRGRSECLETKPEAPAQTGRARNVRDRAVIPPRIAGDALPRTHTGSASDDPVPAQSTGETGEGSFERHARITPQRIEPRETSPIGEPMTVDPDNTGASASDRHAHTGFGGLMFLLWLIEPSGVLDAVQGEAPLARRGLRWTLRRLALQLLPLAADDPVLAAFAGLAPLDAHASPAQDEEPMTPAEAADITVLTNRLEALLRERLDEQRSRERMLDTVCRRAADIHFEPGWIELHFALDAASTAIRRSGLDRDLGWVPWLGTVVRFVYV